MDISTLASAIPDTTIGLVAFITLAYLSTTIWLISYFMTYIQKKNANLERTSENFAKHLNEMTARAERERKDMEERLRQCLVSK